MLLLIATGIVFAMYKSYANRSTQVFDSFFGAMASGDSEGVAGQLSVPFDPVYLAAMCKQLQSHHGPLRESRVITSQWTPVGPDESRFTGSARLFFQRGTGRAKIAGSQRAGESIRVAAFALTCDGLERWRTPPGQRETYHAQAEALIRAIFEGRDDDALALCGDRLRARVGRNMVDVARAAKATVGDVRSLELVAEGVHPTLRILHLYFSVAGSVGERIARCDISWPQLQAQIHAFDTDYRGPLPTK